MPSKQKYRVYVAVFKGNPVDFYKYRHAGLWFVPEGSGSHYYFHIRGMESAFVYEKRENFDPTLSQTFANKVDIGKTKVSVTSSELTTVLESIAVRNDDPEFNCQQWVQRALMALYRKGYLTKQQYELGLAGMIDITMEAEDEDIA